MTSAGHVREEVAANLEVLLLLMFMVAGIYFMKQLLLFIFTRLLLSIRSKMLLSLSFCRPTKTNWVQVLLVVTRLTRMLALKWVTTG